MPRGIPTDPSIRAEVVDQIRNNGMSVKIASEQYGVESRLIYSWLRGQVIDGNRSEALEVARLKKELDIAYRLLGRFTAEASRSKK